MDYDINLDSLDSKSADFESMKSAVEDIYNEFNSCYLSNIDDATISSLKTKIKTNIDRLKNGYTNSNSWIKKYIQELNELEEKLASFSGEALAEPVEFNGEFVDLFGKKTMPILQTNGDIHANATKEPEVTTTGDIELNGSVIDTSNPVGTGTTYNLTDNEIAFLAYVAKREQGSVEGAKLELSLMLNLYEKNKSKYSSVTDYVERSGWFAKNSRTNYTYPGDAYVAAANEVIRQGNRYLPSNVVEHDCLSDITSISTGNPRNRSDYIPGQTVIHNRYGATYLFQGFAPNDGDPFGNLV